MEPSTGERSAASRTTDSQPVGAVGDHLKV